MFIEGRHFYWCGYHNIVILRLNNVFNVQSSGHQSSSHICFLVILANSSFARHKIAQAQFKGCFAILTFQRSRFKKCKVVPLAWQLRVHFNL